MIHDMPSAAVAAAYATLLLAILGLWAGPAVWVPLSLTAIVLGYASGVLSSPAALWIGLLALACVLHVRLASRPAELPVRIARLATGTGIVAIVLLLGTHAAPGFHNLRVAQDVVLSPGAAPYTLYLNFDKALAGVLLLGVVHRSLLDRAAGWLEALRRAMPVLALTVGVLMIASLALGYVRFEPRWHSLFLLWAPANFFVTCLSEEAFFRGFIQRGLHKRLDGRRGGTALAIAISAAAFGIAHFAGGWTYVLLATLAGIGYAVIYARTRRIEMAILTHFAVNATHFLLFTYPRLAA